MWYCRSHYDLIKKPFIISSSKIPVRECIIEGNIIKVPIWVNWVDWYALIDKDQERITQSNWFMNKRWYTSGRCRNYKKFWVMHRFIIGDIPKWMAIDHINRNKLDNRKCNLRIVTYSENPLNRWVYKTSKSGYKGITRTWKDKKRRALIKVKWKYISLWCYKTPEEANEARRKYEKENFIVYQL